MKGISAVIATILMLMITIAMAGVAFMYIQGIFTQETAVKLELDENSRCAPDGTITVVLRNGGTSVVTADKISISGTASDGTPLGGIGLCGAAGLKLSAGGNATECTTRPTGGKLGSNTLVAVGPSNTARGVVYCIV